MSTHARPRLCLPFVLGALCATTLACAEAERLGNQLADGGLLPGVPALGLGDGGVTQPCPMTVVDAGPPLNDAGKAVKPSKKKADGGAPDDEPCVSTPPPAPPPAPVKPPAGFPDAAAPTPTPTPTVDAGPPVTPMPMPMPAPGVPDAAPPAPVPSAPRCPAFTGCGGDVVGTWEYQPGCFEDSPPDPRCPGGVLSNAGLKMAGTKTYAADGTFKEEGLLFGTQEAKLPLSCTEAKTCAELTALRRQNLSPEYTDINCTGEGPMCSCVLNVRSKPFGFGGVWKTLAGHLLENGVDVGEYCVAGAQLNIAMPPTRGNVGYATLTRK